MWPWACCAPLSRLRRGIIPSPRITSSWVICGTYQRSLPTPPMPVALSADAPWRGGRVGRSADEDVSAGTKSSPAPQRGYPFSNVNAEAPDYAQPSPSANGVHAPADQVQTALQAMQQAEMALGEARQAMDEAVAALVLS